MSNYYLDSNIVIDTDIDINIDCTEKKNKRKISHPYPSLCVTIEREFDFESEIIYSCDLESNLLPKLLPQTPNSCSTNSYSPDCFVTPEKNPLSNKYKNSPNSLRIPGTPIPIESKKALFNCLVKKEKNKNTLCAIKK